MHEFNETRRSKRIGRFVVFIFLFDVYFIYLFLDYLTDVYGNLAMVNYPYPSAFLAPLPAYPVMEFCSRFSDKITNETELIDV